MTKALEIDHLTKTYGNGFQALKGVSFSVEQGDFFALLGPNGAGKSTTLGIVSSLVNKTSGTVRIFGHDLETDVVAAKKCLGVVPQEINFSQFEKVEDILVTQGGYYGIPAAEARATSEHYLRQLGLWDKRHQASRMLSGGMKRRLMIARALIHKPRLLILDEPTAGVDIELRRSMWQFLTELNASGTTIILTTHYLEEAEALCQRIAIIDRGEILENTTKQSLLQKLQSESFILETQTQLTSIPPLAPFEGVLTRTGELEVQVRKGQSLNQLFSVLSASGIEVRSMRQKANRLEELFLNLVGRHETDALASGARHDA